MSVIIILILASLAMALLFLGCFVWAVRSGQFEDTLTPAMRVLPDESQATQPPPAAGPALPLTLTLSRREREQQSPSLSFSDPRPAISDAQNLQERRRILPLPAGEGRGEGEPCEFKTNDTPPSPGQIQK
jgi:cbb3-type cytochrome oxidase maturation protein